MDTWLPIEFFIDEPHKFFHKISNFGWFGPHLRYKIRNKSNEWINSLG